MTYENFVNFKAKCGGLYIKSTKYVKDEMSKADFKEEIESAKVAAYFSDPKIEELFLQGENKKAVALFRNYFRQELKRFNPQGMLVEDRKQFEIYSERRRHIEKASLNKIVQTNGTGKECRTMKEAETRMQLESLLKCLTDEERYIVKTKQSYTFKDIAENLGKSESTIKTTYNRAIKKIRLANEIETKEEKQIRFEKEKLEEAQKLNLEIIEKKACTNIVNHDTIKTGKETTNIANSIMEVKIMMNTKMETLENELVVLVKKNAGNMQGAKSVVITVLSIDGIEGLKKMADNKWGNQSEYKVLAAKLKLAELETETTKVTHNTTKAVKTAPVAHMELTEQSTKESTVENKEVKKQSYVQLQLFGHVAKNTYTYPTNAEVIAQAVAMQVEDDKLTKSYKKTKLEDMKFNTKMNNTFHKIELQIFSSPVKKGKIMGQEYTYSTNTSKNSPKAYKAYKNMMTRCYDANYHIKNPQYANCTVSADWHNFDNFCKWFDTNYKTKWQLDKDLTCKGNTTYSKFTCNYLPRKVNKFISTKYKNNTTGVTGVYITKSGKFTATVNDFTTNKSKGLGTYETIQGAKNAYLVAKEYEAVKCREYALNEGLDMSIVKCI